MIEVGAGTDRRSIRVLHDVIGLSTMDQTDSIPCATHPDRASVASCSVCDKALCQDCRRESHGATYCEVCVEIAPSLLREEPPRPFRTLLAFLAGAVLSVAALLGWDWAMFRTEFGLARFTSQGMLCVALAAVAVMRRVSGRRPAWLRLLAYGLVIGMLLGGEYIQYQYVLFQAARQQRLTAEQLLRYSEQYTYLTHLRWLGPFDYLFMLAGLFVTWRWLRNHR